jgi:hypothetical protein
LRLRKRKKARKKKREKARRRSSLAPSGRIGGLNYLIIGATNCRPYCFSGGGFLTGIVFRNREAIEVVFCFIVFMPRTRPLPRPETESGAGRVIFAKVSAML